MIIVMIVAALALLVLLFRLGKEDYEIYKNARIVARLLLIRLSALCLVSVLIYQVYALVG